MPHKKKRISWDDYPYVIRRKPHTSGYSDVMVGDYVPSDWRTHDLSKINYPGYGERDEDAGATTETLMVIGSLVVVAGLALYLGNLLQQPAV